MTLINKANNKGGSSSDPPILQSFDPCAFFIAHFRLNFIFLRDTLWDYPPFTIATRSLYLFMFIAFIICDICIAPAWASGSGSGSGAGPAWERGEDPYPLSLNSPQPQLLESVTACWFLLPRQVAAVKSAQIYAQVICAFEGAACPKGAVAGGTSGREWAGAGAGASLRYAPEGPAPLLITSNGTAPQEFGHSPPAMTQIITHLSFKSSRRSRVAKSQQKKKIGKLSQLRAAMKMHFRLTHFSRPTAPNRPAPPRPFTFLPSISPAISNSFSFQTFFAWKLSQKLSGPRTAPLSHYRWIFVANGVSQESGVENFSPSMPSFG